MAAEAMQAQGISMLAKKEEHDATGPQQLLQKQLRTGKALQTKHAALRRWEGYGRQVLSALDDLEAEANAVDERLEVLGKEVRDLEKKLADLQGAAPVQHAPEDRADDGAGAFQRPPRRRTAQRVAAVPTQPLAIEDNPFRHLGVECGDDGDDGDDHDSQGDARMPLQGHPVSTGRPASFAPGGDDDDEGTAFTDAGSTVGSATAMARARGRSALHQAAEMPLRRHALQQRLEAAERFAAETLPRPAEEAADEERGLAPTQLDDVNATPTQRGDGLVPYADGESGSEHSRADSRRGGRQRDKEKTDRKVAIAAACQDMVAAARTGAEEQAAGVVARASSSRDAAVKAARGVLPQG